MSGPWRTPLFHPPVVRPTYNPVVSVYNTLVLGKIVFPVAVFSLYTYKRKFDIEVIENTQYNKYRLYQRERKTKIAKTKNASIPLAGKVNRNKIFSLN